MGGKKYRPKTTTERASPPGVDNKKVVGRGGSINAIYTGGRNSTPGYAAVHDEGGARLEGGLQQCYWRRLSFVGASAALAVHSRDAPTAAQRQQGSLVPATSVHGRPEPLLCRP